MMSSIELAQVIAMFHGLSKAFEAGIWLLWVETNLKNPLESWLVLLDMRMRFKMLLISFKIMVLGSVFGFL